MSNDTSCCYLNCDEFGSMSHPILDNKFYCSRHFYEKFEEAKKIQQELKKQYSNDQVENK